jgi:hypothetical protein
MKVSKVLNPDFEAALKRLMSLADVPTPVRFKLRKIKADIENAKKIWEDTRMDIVAIYAEKDEAGNVKTTEINGQQTTKIPAANLREANAKLSELDVQEVNISNIPICEFGPAGDKLTADDLFLFDFIIE